jgi:alkylhydroperoxidase family enzyme
MKTAMSRFQIHDDLTAPEGSLPILKGALSTAGQLPNLLGVLAGSPATLRAYARFRSELRHGLARAADAGADLARRGRPLPLRAGEGPPCPDRSPGGLGLDEVAAAQQWTSSDLREAALLRYLRPMVVDHGKPPMHLHEEAREAGWSDASLLEAIAYGGIEAFTAMINVAGEVPSTDPTRTRAR